MNEQDCFSYDRFISLTGLEHCDYAEPFVTTRPAAIPESAYDPLQAGLAAFDDEHTVYALEICMRLRPSAFIDRVVGHLAHADSSVCCTAYNLLTRVSPSSMPANLAREIANIPVIGLFTADIHTGDRIRIGTNRQFLHDLVERFPPTSDDAPQDVAARTIGATH